MKTSDEIQLRNKIYSDMDFTDVNCLVDLGCGKGFDLSQIHQKYGQAVNRLIGIDNLPRPSEFSTDFEYIHYDLDQGIPLPDGTADMLFSINFLECVSDLDSLTEEMVRVLTPSGKIVIAHFDWDAQIINGHDKDLTRRMVRRFADWKQDWMKHSDGWIGRRLWGVFNHTHWFDGNIKIYQLINTEFKDGTYGKLTINSFHGMIRHGLANEAEYEAFHDGIEKMVELEQYFFSIPMVVYFGQLK